MELVWQHRWGADVYPLSTSTLVIVLRIARCTPVARLQVHYGDRYELDFRSCKDAKHYGSDGAFDYFTCEVEVPTRRLKYAFEAVSSSGQVVYLGEGGLATTLDAVPPYQYPYIHPSQVLTVPEWAGNTVAYEVFPDRFSVGGRLLICPSVPWEAHPTTESVFGGNLRGITDKLPYLRDLGVNLLYLTPIFQAPSNHKYDTQDYFNIDPSFGTLDDLRSLVQEAHRLGIRVVLDAVFNHSGFRFSPFQDVIQRGRASSYWSWFFVDGDHVDVESVNYETFATRLRHMPKLNLAEPAVQEYLLAVAKHYVLECDIDGWRFDVANEIDPHFWPLLRAELRALKPDILLIGEIWHDGLPWLTGDAFDGVMNYPLRDLVLRYAVDEAIDEVEFAHKWVRLYLQYPRPAWRAMWNLLGSHDTERALTRARGHVPSVVLAFAMLFTLPGIPMVYYGDEIGMEGGTDPDCRRGMIWNENLWKNDLREAVRQLAWLKRTHPALAGDTMEIRDANSGVLHYVRLNGTGPHLHIAVCKRRDFGAEVDSPRFAWDVPSRTSGEERKILIWECDSTEGCGHDSRADGFHNQ
ncbi:alpha amylase N-terminal ig-like domain-containing protein [Alicyclobacillus mali]|uniref:Alpha amylase N-terminal ig-like domain-containing protein n=1 Tax=Alicyclobacillus mali (ex Roth et al. 2021) TaxID=1123961 RepID=A0ABS0F1X7_9BACL|nr:glycoside hydrolase family 13 protein [Alicyclobacillus mali (ex Roth et al. 2021)]MBF8377307.1 alpha amylase N-terminal ig-like domain-containing protein [Alicyclobacillus mali (ex Roth et al. 2021)]